MRECGVAALIVMQARPTSLNTVVTELGHIVNAMGGDPRSPPDYQVTQLHPSGAIRKIFVFDVSLFRPRAIGYGAGGGTRSSFDDTVVQ